MSAIILTALIFLTDSHHSSKIIQKCIIKHLVQHIIVFSESKANQLAISKRDFQCSQLIVKALWLVNYEKQSKVRTKTVKILEKIYIVQNDAIETNIRRFPQLFIITRAAYDALDSTTVFCLAITQLTYKNLMEW